MKLTTLLTAADDFPEREALVSGDRTLTRRQVRDNITGLSRHLGLVGVRPGDRILLLARKSEALVTLIHACLDQGIVFVPLDCDTPRERLGYIIADCAPVAAVVSDELADRLGPELLAPIPLLLSFDGVENQPRCHRLDMGPEAAGATAVHAPARAELDDQDLAYIMYTSGSTGAPKGVAVSRGALANFLGAAIERAGYSESTRFLSFFPLHFDPILMEIIAPWITGGTVVLFGPFLFVNDLVKALQQYAITDFSCTPNVLTMLVGRASRFDQYEWPHLRSIWFGGERANVPDVKAIRQVVPSVHLFNGYGPTETVVACSVHTVSDDDLDSESLPIGTPLDSVLFRIGAEGREVLEDDVAGELLVGGGQVMTTYWGATDPDANGFVQIDGTTYFRTRDLVSRRNGVYHFIDRIDDMVKIRGFRIFPSEVVRALNDMAEIHQAYVFAAPDGSHLVAVVESEALSSMDPTQAGRLVADHLADRVPSYMIPSLTIARPLLPRMSSGKLDTQCIRTLVREKEATA